ncbi:MAG: formate dehydrogenase subunit gamma [Pigmentiphaga sp.]
MTRPTPLPPAGFSVESPTPKVRAALSAADLAAVQAILSRHAGQPGILLPVLHDVQDELGCIPPEAVPVIAQAMQLSRAEVHGVITFYPHYRSTPAGRHHIELCRAEACQSMGANALVAHAERRLSCDLKATSADGRYTLDPVYCLGLCAQSPAMMVDGQPYARLTPERFDAILDQLGEAQA